MLRASVLALAYSPAEYCAPAWTQSAHTHKIDIPFNEAMRLVSGCLRSTPVSQLPFLSGIPPPQEHRYQICIKTCERAQSIHHLLYEILHIKDAPSCLPSRRPLQRFVENLTSREQCPLLIPDQLAPFITQCTTKPSGCSLPRNAWVQLNQLISGGISSACLCGEIQTGNHILKCHTIGPPCPLQNVEDPRLINYLTLCNFFVIDCPYSLLSPVLLLQYILLLLIYTK